MDRRKILLMSGRPRWLLAGNPSLQLDWNTGNAWLNNRQYRGETAFKSLFSTFTTPACYVTDTAGVLKLMPANSEHGIYGSDRGQLIEEARTNLLTYSQAFDNAAWSATNAVVVADNAAAPDGTVTADKITDNTTSGAHLLTSSSFSFVSGTTYTYSQMFKMNDQRYVQLGLPSSAFGLNAYANFDLQAGTVGTVGSSATASIVALSGGYYRCVVIAPATSSSSNVSFFGFVTSSSGARGQSYVGTGTSVWTWGAPLEAGAFATSYIPTTSAAVTRTKSTLSRTIEASYSAASGSAYVEFISANGSGTQRIWQIDTDVNNRISLTRNASNQIILDVVVGGASQASVNLGTLANATKGKVAINWTAGACAGSLNGAAVVTGTPASIPTVTTERFGSDAAAANQLNGYYTRSGRYQQVLTSAQLVSLTA
tara:strand:- start:26385 stop:27665 length:1281 start_codon:yes stop_codon:yes gene_type:complete